MKQLSFSAYLRNFGSSLILIGGLSSAHAVSAECTRNQDKVFVSAAYTYWSVQEDGLALTMSNCYNDTVTSLYSPLGEIKEVPFNTVSGFKVGAGRTSPSGDWSLMLQYTWFYNIHPSTLSLNSTNNLNTSLVPAYPFTGVFPFETLSGAWKNYFNRIDWLFINNISIDSTLTLRPFFGLLTAWDKQKLTLSAYIPSGSFEGTSGVWTSTQKWWSVGPYCGIDGDFHLFSLNCHAFSLFGTAGFALGWGNYKTYQIGQGSTFGEATSFLNARKSLQIVSPMGESSLGLRWKRAFRNDQYDFLLQAAWELQAWIGHNQMTPYLFTGGNFYLQGLTLKGSLSF